ncbi:MAG: amino acid adenylation domain-containing protein [Pseudomonadota bacterium]
MAIALHQLAIEAAGQRPEGEAVRCGNEALRWAELVLNSNGMAHALNGFGLKRGDRVAVFLTKSLRVPVAFYGVFAAGGALVPIDPKTPIDQAVRILRRTGARFLVSEVSRTSVVTSLLAACPEIKYVLGLNCDMPAGVNSAPWSTVDELASYSGPDLRIGSLDNSYIMHTSGSTGEPKLICHTHSSAIAFAEWSAREYGLTCDDRLSNHSSHHTCFATFDFYAAARAAAATVLLPPAAMMMPASLAELLERECITVWYSVPTALVQLLLQGNLAERNLNALRWVLFAGEVFPDKHLRALCAILDHARFSQVYGSTEVNVCTYYHLPANGAFPNPLPIGQPCAGDRALVVNETLDRVSCSEAGELLISGATVMTGYWGDPERNGRAFVSRSEPGGFEARWFRTGDQVKQDDDGNLIFAGRTDYQVKVRGFRVELEEIESALLSINSVREAVALAMNGEDGDAQLCAVIVCDPLVEITERDLRSNLQHTLPPYAIPSELHLASSLPRTPTGKIDRKALTLRYEQKTEEWNQSA